MDKKIARLRRAKTTRSHIKKLGVPRLSDGATVLAAASTLEPSVKDGLANGKNKDAAAKVGRIIAEKAKAAGVESVAFDRSGYRFHGRVKALAEAAREAGLQF